MTFMMFIHEHKKHLSTLKIKFLKCILKLQIPQVTVEKSFGQMSSCRKPCRIVSTEDGKYVFPSPMKIHFDFGIDERVKCFMRYWKTLPSQNHRFPSLHFYSVFTHFHDTPTQLFYIPMNPHINMCMYISFFSSYSLNLHCYFFFQINYIIYL